MNVEKTEGMRISRQPLPAKIMIDQKQPENVESFKYLGSMLTNDRRCTCEIKSRVAMAKAAFNKNYHISLKIEEETSKMLHLEHSLYGSETWTIRAVDQKHLERFEMWCWRRMENISLTDHVRNDEELLRVEEQRNILHEISKRKANWIGHVLRRN